MPNAPLTVSFIGNDLVVTLATGANGALTSTAAQVAAAINAHPGAAAKLVAQTYRGNAGAGVVQARPKGNLSDFLDDWRRTRTSSAGRSSTSCCGSARTGRATAPTRAIHGRRVGVFLYCQQHAREWATPLTCLETAEQLLRNYGIDKTTRKLVDELDIFILPSSNPDGAHYSMHNFNSQRKTMTNWCMVGGLETDDPNAANFWTPRPNLLPGGAAQPFNDSAARNAWGTDMNRNNTFGTLIDGYIGASVNVHQRNVRRAVRGLRAGDQERALDRGHVQEHQVLEQHPQLRRLLHVGAGHVPAGSRRGRGRAREHRRREVLLRGR